MIGLLMAATVGCARGEASENPGEAQDPWTVADCLKMHDHNMAYCEGKKGSARSLCVAAVLAAFAACESTATNPANDNGTGFAPNGGYSSSGLPGYDSGGSFGGTSDSGYSGGGGLSEGGGSTEGW